MRNIKKYESDYINQPYEKYQVKYRKKKVIECLNNFKHDNILEIGCGLEPIFNHIKDYKNLFIVEPGDYFYENAVKLTEGNNNIKVLHGFFEDYVKYLSKYKFDFIILSGLLHEVENQEQMLMCIRALCLEETIVHVNVPTAKSFHRMLGCEMGLTESIYEKSLMQKKMQQNDIFDLEKLISIVKNNGFKVIDSGSYFFKPFTHEQMQKLVDMGIVNDEMLDGFYKIIKYLPEFGSEIYVNVKKDELRKIC